MEELTREMIEKTGVNKASAYETVKKIVPLLVAAADVKRTKFLDSTITVQIKKMEVELKELAATHGALMDATANAFAEEVVKRLEAIIATAGNAGIKSVDLYHPVTYWAGVAEYYGALKEWDEAGLAKLGESHAMKLYFMVRTYNPRENGGTNHCYLPTNWRSEEQKKLAKTLRKLNGMANELKRTEKGLPPRELRKPAETTPAPTPETPKTLKKRKRAEEPKPADGTNNYVDPVDLA